MALDSDDATLKSLEEIDRARAAWEDRPRHASQDAAYRAFVEELRRDVPFYRDAGAELPLTDRAVHQENGERFRSPHVPAAYRLSSSGTTGKPLEVTLDDAAWYTVNYRFFAQVLEVAGLSADIFRRGEPAVVFVSNKPGRSSFVRPLPPLGNGLYVRLQLGGADVLRLFSRLRAPVLYGKPTYLLDLRAALLGQGAAAPPWTPRLLLVSGEPLHADDRRRLTDYFRAPVVDALASTEGGLVAATEPDASTYRVIGENVRLEVRDEHGAVRPDGAGELVLTNLVNRGTFVARYLTGDHAELATAADGTQRLLRLRGREPGTLRFRTARLPAEAVTAAVGHLPGLGDFQVDLRDPDRTVLRWAPDPGCPDEDALRVELRAAVDRLLPGEEPVLERHERITPPGGKKRRFLTAAPA
ncbi:AMP-binding protein [Streptomyces sp. DH12]|uniref:AMP-binding protein n=1 Tax=Streptomyces sp. DH12 TaxID=2857010 RepID=UPI001E542B31|nr:AMP-binding protein [Streptomyces sp. DH12]